MAESCPVLIAYHLWVIFLNGFVSFQSDMHVGVTC